LIDIETGKVIEFQDSEHERLMHAIAARLGFTVVSLRLELFGRRRDGSAPPDDGDPRPEHPSDSPAAGRDPRLRDPIKGASR